MEGKEEAKRERKKLFNVTLGLQESGHVEAGVVQTCPSPLPHRSVLPQSCGMVFLPLWAQSYFKRKQLACFPAQVGLAKLSPSNHSLGIYFCPPDFPRHFLGLFFWFLLGVMEHDKNREKSQAQVHSFEKFTVQANTRLRTPRQGLIARAG